ncbi:MAG: DUF932 domain-containing protein [Bacillota bacterium]
MAHEISMVNGIGEAAFALTPAWHGKGVVVDHVFNSEEAIKLAHLDWTVEQKPVFAFDQKNNRAVQVPGRLANVRSDTGDVLAIVSSRYRPFQNWECFAFCDKLVMDGIVKYNACGALKGGRVVWMLCELPQQAEIVEGDVVKHYGLLYTGHDGSFATTIQSTETRVVCWNTLSAAIDSAERMLRIRHTKNMDKQVEQARKLLGIAQDQFNRQVEDSRKLAAVKISDESYRAFRDEIVPAPLAGPMPPHRDRIRAMIDKLYFEDACQNMPGVARTGWAAVNAVTHFVDHEMKARGKTAEQKSDNTLYSVMLGRGNQIKQKAMATATSMFVGA